MQNAVLRTHAQAIALFLCAGFLRGGLLRSRLLRSGFLRRGFLRSFFLRYGFFRGRLLHCGFLRVGFFWRLSSLPVLRVMALRRLSSRGFLCGFLCCAMFFSFLLQPSLNGQLFSAPMPYMDITASSIWRSIPATGTCLLASSDKTWHQDTGEQCRIPPLQLCAIPFLIQLKNPTTQMLSGNNKTRTGQVSSEREIYISQFQCQHRFHQHAEKFLNTKSP